MSDPIAILSTCGSYDEAQKIGSVLVNERLAACVNIVPGVTSIYRWQGAVEQASEHLLIIKTTASQWPEVQRRLKDMHSYEVPEIIKLPVSGGSKPYLEWLSAQVEIVP